MADSLQHFLPIAMKQSAIQKRFRAIHHKYQLLTLHRPSNADDLSRLKKILWIIEKSGVPTVFPVHPRTQKIISKIRGKRSNVIFFIPPVGYLDMLVLQKNAVRILTDSGGIQKEAYLLKVPCITIRSETEWKETTQHGWNQVVGRNLDNLVRFLSRPAKPGKWLPYYGNGKASTKIAKTIRHFFKI